jgi:hypothetical protein
MLAGEKACTTRFVMGFICIASHNSLSFYPPQGTRKTCSFESDFRDGTFLRVVSRPYYFLEAASLRGRENTGAKGVGHHFFQIKPREEKMNTAGLGVSGEESHANRVKSLKDVKKDIGLRRAKLPNGERSSWGLRKSTMAKVMKKGQAWLKSEKKK